MYLTSQKSIPQIEENKKKTFSAESLSLFSTSSPSTSFSCREEIMLDVKLHIEKIKQLQVSHQQRSHSSSSRLSKCIKQ